MSLIGTVILLFISGGYALPQSKGQDLRQLKLKDVVSDKEISLSDFSKKKAVVAIFFCNDCPYSTFYIERIKALTASYPDFQILLINSSNSEYVPEESDENMKDFIMKNDLSLPYISDKDKTAMKTFGARKCPEAFLVKTKDWKIVYQGAIDNNPQVADDVSHHYLREALDQLISGKPVTTSFIRPMGCVIK